MQLVRAGLAVAVAIVTAACSTDETQAKPSQPEIEPAAVPADKTPLDIDVGTGVARPNPNTDSARLASDDEATLVDAAMKQLAGRLGSDAGIELEAFARVVWPDGSLGCPQPGIGYTQALVEGYRVILKARNRAYHYHGRSGRAPKFCPRPQAQGNWQMDR